MHRLKPQEAQDPKPQADRHPIAACRAHRNGDKPGDAAEPEKSENRDTHSNPSCCPRQRHHSCNLPLRLDFHQCQMQHWTV